MKKRWLLMNPPTGKYIRDTRCQASVNDIFAVVDRAPVDLAYIAGGISSNGHECIIKDYPAEGLGWKDMIEDVNNFNINYVVINTTMYSYEDDLKVAEICKNVNSNIVTIAKGAIFFSNPEKIMERFPQLDIAVTCEEEKVFKDLSSSFQNLQDIKNIIFKNGEKIIMTPQGFEEKLELPLPRIDLIKHDLYLRPDTQEKQATIVVGRGCPGKCIYCIAPIVGGNIARYRKMKIILDEIRTYYYRYGIKNFYFSADTFTFNHKWVLEFCDEIKKLEFKISWLCTARADTISLRIIHAMKSAGCWGVSIGVESGNEDIQKLIKKNLSINVIKNAVDICKSNRIVTLLHFMLGFPWDNKERIEETVRLAKQLNGNIMEFYVVIPLPGTELYKMIEKDSELVQSQSIRNSNQVIPITNTYYLTTNEINILRRKAIRSIYFNPVFYFKQIKYIHSFSQLINCARYLATKIIQIMIKNLKIES